MIKIYHNPRCSKSCAALATVEQFARERGEQLEIMEYLLRPPSAEQLGDLQRLGIPLRSMVRDGEELFSELQLQDADDERLLQALAAHPVLLQRPIVVYRDRAVVARPPELLEAFLGQD